MSVLGSQVIQFKYTGAIKSSLFNEFITSYNKLSLKCYEEEVSRQKDGHVTGCNLFVIASSPHNTLANGIPIQNFFIQKNDDGEPESFLTERLTQSKWFRIFNRT